MLKRLRAAVQARFRRLVLVEGEDPQLHQLRLVTIPLAAGLPIEVFGLRSGRWYWVKIDGDKVIDVSGPHAFEGALAALTAMAQAAKADRWEEPKSDD